MGPVLSATGEYRPPRSYGPRSASRRAPRSFLGPEKPSTRASTRVSPGRERTVTAGSSSHGGHTINTPEPPDRRPSPGRDRLRGPARRRAAGHEARSMALSPKPGASGGSDSRPPTTRRDSRQPESPHPSTMSEQAPDPRLSTSCPAPAPVEPLAFLEDDLPPRALTLVVLARFRPASEPRNQLDT